MKKNPVPAQSSTATEPAMPSPVRAIDSPVCSAVSFVKPTAGRRRHRDFKINEPFKINKRREIPAANLITTLFSESEELISRQRPAILL
jgi:hypothetical protein